MNVKKCIIVCITKMATSSKLAVTALYYLSLAVFTGHHCKQLCTLRCYEQSFNPVTHTHKELPFLVFLRMCACVFVSMCVCVWFKYNLVELNKRLLTCVHNDKREKHGKTE